jgi:hypothetical protein
MGAMREEVGRLFTFEEQHRRLMARLALLVVATALLDVVASVLMYALERSASGSEIRTLGQAFFFTTVQLLTVSSQIKNPVTPVGRVVDVVLEVWAVVAVAGSAGAVASFFQTSDSS